VYVRAGTALVVALGIALAQAGRAAEPWSVLVIVYDETDATCTLPSGSTHVSTTLTPPERLYVEAGIHDFEQVVSEWSGGLGSVAVVVKSSQREITRVTPTGIGCIVLPEDVAADLDELLPAGDYDSVIAIWPHKNGSTALPGPLGAAPGGGLVAWRGRTITFGGLHADAFVPSGSNFRDPGEAIVHEWLHQVGLFYRSNGYAVPDADESAIYGFSDANPDGVGGFGAFYTALMQGKLVDPLGRSAGISPAVWEFGSLRPSTRAVPPPQQLVAPLDFACATPEMALEWLGPPLAQAVYEVTLRDELGGQIVAQTNQTEIALSSLPLQASRTYRWKVRSLSAPAGSEAEELEFSNGPPAPPSFRPDGGLLSSFGSAVFIHAGPRAEIHYTLDGGDPTAGDLLVPPTGEVQVEPPRLLKARAFSPNCPASSVKSALYGFADVLTVTSVDDSPIGPPQDGTLRKAIADANLAPGRQEIRFAIPGPGVHTIDIGAPLPVITDPVILDGWSQPGFAGSPLIEIDGTASGSGLVVQGGSTSIRGLIVNNSGGHGIRLELLGDNWIRGCYVGTNATGTAARANLGSGIFVNGVGANLIGGFDAQDRNVLSGNGFHGVELSGAGAADNLIVNNFIGTDRTGTSRLSNRHNGVQLSGAPRNRIGGRLPGARNLISGNGFSGLANTGDGIGIGGPGADGNVVEGNWIGTDVNGAADLGNSRNGVIVSSLVSGGGPSASGNRIGGTDPGARNVISGNDANGISIVAENGGASGNLVQGNYIGTDASGSFDLGNSLSGVELSRASASGSTAASNSIGGTEPGAGNVISGNSLDGVTIVGWNASGEGNLVQGNYIGTDAQGIFDVGNTRSGVRLTTASAFADTASFNRVGGDNHAARNVISGNDQNGVAIVGKTTGGNNYVLGNLIGLAADGTAGPGNGGDGILITTSVFGGTALINSIGGTSPGAHNVIGRNGGAGIRIEGAGATDNFIEGNRIGIDARGVAQPNAGDGIFASAPDNSFVANTIAWNAGAGAVISAASGDRLRSNSIFQNGALGIDLINGNGMQPAPVLGAATTTSGTIFSGSLSAAPVTEYTLEFFASPTCDPSGAGEGMTPLETISVTTAANGSAAFLVPSPAPVPPGQVVTATATRFASDDT
jgi:hypothetical protein